MLKQTAIMVALGLLLTGCGATQAGAAPVEDEAAFLARCKAEGGFDCGVKWRWAGNAAPMADALLALAPESGGAPTDARARLDAVKWSSPREGALGDLAVTMPASGKIAFRWRKLGSEGHYDLIQALRIRGVTLESLGCPQYPGASMGQEKVMVARTEGRVPFVMTVYHRAAPMSSEFGVYEVDADFSGAVPDRAALATGQYPGGGGRAFAVDPTGWTINCPDPGL